MFKNTILDINKNNIENSLDPNEYEIMEVPLSEFPHGEFTNHVDGKNGPIDFYSVAPETKVLAINEQTGNLRWADVKSWSKHESREIVIVNLSNGLQIITDDDPRAVYGITETNLKAQLAKDSSDDIELKFERFTPRHAITGDVYVPCKLNPALHSILEEANRVGFDNVILDALDDEDLEKINSRINTIEDALRIQTNYLLNCNIILQLYVDENNNWKLKKFNPEIDYIFIKDDRLGKDIIYVRAISAIFTHKKETGYDLTVPGYETFMAANGIVLSNTINVHVPGLPEAVDDTINKLMPSKNIFQIRDLRNIANPIKQDFMISLFTSANTPAEKRYVFKTKEDALRAIKRGTVKLSDEVEFPNS